MNETKQTTTVTSRNTVFGLRKRKLCGRMPRVCIRLDGAVLAAIKMEAVRLGIPYQTLVGSILHRYASGELLDRKSAQLAKLIKNVSW